MDCQEIKKLIPVYLDDELEATERQRVAAHLRACADCRAEARAIEKSWELLAEIKEIEPDPNYRIRFWRSVDARMPWYATLGRYFQPVFFQQRWLPAVAGAAIVVMISIIAVVQFLQSPQMPSVLAELKDTELEMVATLDLAEDYEIIQDMDFFSDFDVIENMNGLETS